MKKIMMVFALVFMFACGVAGKEVYNEVRKQNDEKFVVTAIYQDEIHPGSAHSTTFNSVMMIGPDLYATEKADGTEVVYVVYNKVGTIGRISFTKEYRKSDGQSRIIVKKNEDEEKCVVYTGDLLRSVVMTELETL